MTSRAAVLAACSAVLLTLAGPMVDSAHAATQGLARENPRLPGQPGSGSGWDGPFVVARTNSGNSVSAWRAGPAGAAVRLVVLGQMHGNEPAGVRVVDQLLGPASPLASLVTPGGGVDGSGTASVAIWLIRSLNPDGAERHRRVNARGVDLNRNFPAGWVRRGAGTSQWSGPAAASEPEVAGLMSFLAEIRPQAVLVMHQDFAVVDTTHARSRPAGSLLAGWLSLPARPVGCSGPCHGTLTQWVDQALGAIALTVELPKVVTRADAIRDADAIARFAVWLASAVGR